MTRVLLLRHGQSAWNVQQRWQGHGDPSLTERGRAQARSAARRLAREGIEHVVASDLARALETAQIVAAALGLEPEVDPRWRERDIGIWTGLTREAIAARWPAEYAHFLAHDEHARPGGGESDAMLRARAREALAALRARHPGKCVLVVAHRGIGRMLAPEKPLGNAEWCEVAAPG